MTRNDDVRTARAFASSWNNIPSGSVYTCEQVEDWLAPVRADDIRNKTVLELGCGNAHPEIHPESAYILMRNGNSWKFGGRKL